MQATEAAIVTATDTITVAEGYEAMRICLETIWRRHGKDADQIEFVIAGLKWADGSPVDPTMWRTGWRLCKLFAADGCMVH